MCLLSCTRVMFVFPKRGCPKWWGSHEGIQFPTLSACTARPSLRPLNKELLYSMFCPLIIDMLHHMAVKPQLFRIACASFFHCLSLLSRISFYQQLNVSATKCSQVASVSNKCLWCSAQGYIPALQYYWLPQRVLIFHSWHTVESLENHCAMLLHQLIDQHKTHKQSLKKNVIFILKDVSK